MADRFVRGRRFEATTAPAHRFSDSHCTDALPAPPANQESCALQDNLFHHHRHGSGWLHSRLGDGVAGAAANCAHHAVTIPSVRDSTGKAPDFGRAPSVLLVDEHALVRAGLRSLIDTIPGLNVVAEASEMSDAIELAHAHQPDAILVSAAAWANGGADLGPRLRRELPTSCVLVIGGEPVAGGSAGFAGGYCCLPREAGIQEFCAAISSLLGGRCADCGFRSGICPAMQNAALLTRRERQVAVRVADGLTSKQIASMLGVAIRTVNTYRESLARKIGASSAAALTRFVIESGLRDTSAADGDGSSGA